MCTNDARLALSPRSSDLPNAWGARARLARSASTKVQGGDRHVRTRAARFLPLLLQGRASGGWGRGAIEVVRSRGGALRSPPDLLRAELRAWSRTTHITRSMLMLSGGSRAVGVGPFELGRFTALDCGTPTFEKCFVPFPESRAVLEIQKDCGALGEFESQLRNGRPGARRRGTRGWRSTPSAGKPRMRRGRRA